MAQITTASAAAAAGVDDDDIGARIARLGLPARPMVIGKTSGLANCNHQGRCYCNEYTTMLDRGPELPTIPDSPDSEMWRGLSVGHEKSRSTSTPTAGSVRSGTGSGAASALTNGATKVAPTKKLSLSQYAHKKAAANGTGPRASKSPAPGEKKPGEKRPIDRITPDAAQERKPDRREEIRESRVERVDNLSKRLRRTPSPQRPPSTQPPPPPPPPAEKPRPVTSRAPPPAQRSLPLPSPKTTLPPMLSPTLPAILEEALLKDAEARQAPPPLSPTLPLVLEEALAATRESPKLSRGNHIPKRESSVDSSIILKTSQKTVPQPSATEKTVRKSVNAATTGAKKSVSSKVTASPTKTPVSLHLKVPGEPKRQFSLAKETVSKTAPISTGKKRRDTSPSSTKRATSPGHSMKARPSSREELLEDDASDIEPKLSKIIILKFRTKRKYYEQLLKLSSKPNKERVTEAEKRPIPEVGGKSTGKRIWETVADDKDRTPVLKKQKMSETPINMLSDARLDKERERDRSKASTPSKGASGGHSPPPPSSLKREKASSEKVVSLPRKPDNRNGRTPQVKGERTSTPAAVKQDLRPGIDSLESRGRKASNSQPPQSLDPAVQSKAELFSAEHMKYQDLGKRLKYEAEGKIKSDRVGKDSRYPKLLLLDSVLCYIVAFLCEEEANSMKGKGSNAESWRSSIPFVRSVSGRCKDIPQLYGLGRLLEAVILQHLLSFDTDKFENTGIPNTTPHTPEIGASLTPNPHGPNTAKGAHEFITARANLIKSIRDTHTAWTDANQHLTVDELQRFKRTWSQRSIKSIPSGHKLKQPGSYRSDYCLPLHVNSSLLEAVNFGWSFLGEWSNDMGLGWESKVELSRANSGA
ncbi:hypothetical protein BDZ91DRAFT_793245 [Kalaharituber pfeilii]|nr:hypothetical protein BDZ91DRAFT_793245 [Kalaharituber pfeilii]